MSSLTIITPSLATLILCLITALANAQRGGFSINLIHRDSLNSPFYNPNQTLAQRIGNTARRSDLARVHRFSHMLGLNNSNDDAASDPEAPLTTGSGIYLMNISLGTPPFPIVAIADTGSDIIWTQCKPCKHCYKQDAPLFDPKSSRTYRTVSCPSPKCDSLEYEGSSCSSRSKVCQYEIRYGDGSHTTGDIAAETLTLESKTGKVPVALPKTLIGCGHDNTGIFPPEGSGIVGLGGGRASLVSQLGPSIGGKFSYCMVPFSTASASSSTSTMHFGTNAVVSGNGVVSTPFFTDLSMPTFYFLQLQAISVGSKKIAFELPPMAPGSGNIIIDSGTTLFYLPRDFFSQLRDAVESQVTGGTKASGPEEFSDDLCYVADSSLEIPSVTVHFKGADVKLPSENVFLQVDDGVVCLAFDGNGGDFGIYGNVAQQNFLVGYDLKKKTVSFKPTDCTKN